MSTSAASPKASPSPVHPQYGRERFLQRIARRQRHSIPATAGMSQAEMLTTLLAKAGVTAKELNELRVKSNEYTRAVGKSFVKSLAEKKLNGMEYFAKNAQFASNVNQSREGRALAVTAIGRHTWGLEAHTPGPPPPPPAPQSIYLSPDSFYKDCHLHGEGVGSGIDWPWTTDDGTRGGSCDIEYQFSFTPTDTKIYSFGVGVIVAGQFYLVADDGSFDSKEAYADFSCYLEVNQQLPSALTFPDGTSANHVYAYTAPVTLFDEDGQNILDGGSCVGSTRMNLATLLFPGIPVDISVTVCADAWARGDGSIADLNLARPTGAIFCGIVTVD